MCVLYDTVRVIVLYILYYKYGHRMHISRVFKIPTGGQSGRNSFCRLTSGQNFCRGQFDQI